MITRGEDVEASALTQRGWSVSAIASHLGRDRKTVRAYLRPGFRSKSEMVGAEGPILTSGGGAETGCGRKSVGARAGAVNP